MSEPTREEATAAKRFMTLGLVRLGCVVVLALGMAMAREVIGGPFALGVVLAIAGVAGFFFGPYWLTRHWKAQDAQNQ